MRTGYREALSLLILAAGTTTVAQTPTLTDPRLRVTQHAPRDAFQFPTQIEFLGEDPHDFFGTEKDTGRVKRFDHGTVTTVLDLAVYDPNGSEAGLLGMAVHPRFAENGFVYLYYSAAAGAADSESSWADNRLSRFRWNGTTLGEEVVVRRFARASERNPSPVHFGGPIVFGRDGMLYGTVGDFSSSGAEQNTTSQANTSSRVGGVYRVNARGDDADGSAPPDNPFVSHPNPDFHHWYGYGVRNSYGLAIDPVTGNVWDTDNGDRFFDEINIVHKGFNGGWRRLMGPSGGMTGGLVNLPGSSYGDPEFSWEQVVVPTGLTFLAGSVLGPEYDDGLLVSAGGELQLFRLNEARDGFVLSGPLADLVADTRAEDDSLVFGRNFGALELQLGPDGAVYGLSPGLGVVRITPEPAAAALLVLALPAVFLRRPAGGRSFPSTPCTTTTRR